MFTVSIVLIIDTIATLGDCERSIDEACRMPVFPGDYTEKSLQACKKSATLFLNDYVVCAKIADYSARCGCLLNDITEINYTDCNPQLIRQGLDVYNTARNNCITGDTLLFFRQNHYKHSIFSAISACKRANNESVEVAATCKKCSLTTSTSTVPTSSTVSTVSTSTVPTPGTSAVQSTSTKSITSASISTSTGKVTTSPSTNIDTVTSTLSTSVNTILTDITSNTITSAGNSSSTPFLSTSDTTEKSTLPALNSTGNLLVLTSCFSELTDFYLDLPKNHVPAVSFDVDTWEKFVAVFDKSYSSDDIEARKNIYQSNKEAIEAHNDLFEKNLVDYPLELNEFSDLTYEEFLESYTGATNETVRRDSVTTKKRSLESLSENNLPDQFDWTNHDAVTRVKNQGGCGSCWAFGATGAIESQNYLNTKILRELSEQQLLDCTYDQVEGRNGCQGGSSVTAMRTAFDGMYLGNDYPYVARDEECKTLETEKFQQFNEVGRVENNADLIKAHLIAKGPLIVYFWVSSDFGRWSWSREPIYTASQNCPAYPNHAVLLVGYGVENGIPYWRMKNSWGGSFAEGGFFRMKRGENLCTVENYVTYPATQGRQGISSKFRLHILFDQNLDCSIYPGKYAKTITENVIDEGLKSSLQDCADWCQEAGGCKMWTFKMDEQIDRNCLLMSSDEGLDCPVTGCSDSKWISGTSSCGVKQSRNAVLIVGGWDNPGTVEVFFPKTRQSCNVAQYALPAIVHSTTMDNYGDKTILCGGGEFSDHCYEFTPQNISSAWTKYASLNITRYEHTSWASSQGPVLIGGYEPFGTNAETTAELVNGDLLPFELPNNIR